MRDWESSMRILVKTPRGEGAVVGWCPDKTGTPQAIIVSTSGKLIYAGIRDVELLNVPPRMSKRIARLHKRLQKESMREMVRTVRDAGGNAEAINN